MIATLDARPIVAAVLLGSATAPTPPPARLPVPCEVLDLRYDQARERWGRVPRPRNATERNRILRKFT